MTLYASIAPGVHPGRVVLTRWLGEGRDAERVDDLSPSEAVQFAAALLKASELARLEVGVAKPTSATDPSDPS